MMNMVDGSGERIGEEQFKEIEKSTLNQKGSKKILNDLKGEYRMMMVVALAKIWPGQMESPMGRKVKTA